MNYRNGGKLLLILDNEGNVMGMRSYQGVPHRCGLTLGFLLDLPPVAPQPAVK